MPTDLRNLKSVRLVSLQFGLGITNLIRAENGPMHQVRHQLNKAAEVSMNQGRSLPPPFPAVVCKPQV